jgi:hypothetical protein
MSLALVERYRSQLRATDYARIDDAEMAAMRAALQDAQASAAIEGLEPDTVDTAFSEMLFEERATADLRIELSRRFAAELYGAGEAA